MPFKLIIVEDEKIMREGFANLVDWKAMDFEVVAKLEDGRDAIEYLEKNPVDVILTDIKMTFVSGLELAKYVHENKLSAKVVLVSGFKEFEYARQAMRFNVQHFLLKPALMKDVEAVFTEIRNQLESEKAARQAEYEKKEKYDELLKLSQEQFFMDLILGVIKDADEINKRIELLNLKINSNSSRCSIINIVIHDFESYIHQNWIYGKDGLYTAIRNFIFTGDIAVDFYPISNRQGQLKLLAVSRGNLNTDEFTFEITRHLDSAKESVKKFLGLQIDPEVEKSFDNILALAMDSMPPADDSKKVLPGTGNKTAGGNVIGLAKEYIRDHYNRDITLEDIAEHVFLNPIYLSRIFKEQTGENYIDYLIKVRMEKAIELLRDARNKVYEIGNMVGYNSTKYFYQVFKRYTGQTPTEFRESLWGSELAQPEMKSQKDVGCHE